MTCLEKSEHWRICIFDPDTGKVIDIEWYNYFYENLNYKLTFTRPYTMKYYYPYWNGEEPAGGDD